MCSLVEIVRLWCGNFLSLVWKFVVSIVMICFRSGNLSALVCTFFVCTVCLPELGGRIHVAAFTSASVSCLSRQRCIFRIRVFRVFCTSNAMHSVDPMGEDTRVLKKTRTRKTQMTRTRKTRCRCKFLHISKFKALAIPKNEQISPQYSPILPCTPVFQGRTRSSGKMALRQVREDAQMQTLSRQTSSGGL